MSALTDHYYSIFKCHHNRKKREEKHQRIKRNYGDHIFEVEEYDTFEFEKHKLVPFYRKVLCTTLQEAVEANLAAPIANQLNLLEELAIMRELSCTPLQLYSKTTEAIEQKIRQIEEGGDKEKLEQDIETLRKLKLVASDSSVSALRVVAEFCEKAAKIDSLQRDKFSIHALNSIVIQISKIAQDVFHDHGLQELAEEFDRKIQEDLVIPMPVANVQKDQKAFCTSITPDEVNTAAVLMDSMVPANP